MSKLRFHVISCSSEEIDYPAEELNSHGPNTKGWQSVKFSAFPQEIILELDAGESRLSQIQLLSHQSKISSKIEIFIGSGTTLENSTFKRLGYLSLDPNEKSNYQARELKTVYIDNLGKYVKFIIHKNYMNSYNYFNQVGIVAINLIGNEMKPSGDGSKRTYAPVMNNPINDLSLDMNLDPQTTAKLRNLSEAKTRAVAAEDYVTAKKIKAVENDLKDLGTRLAQLEIAKRKAVENEDYDRAKDLKDECDAMREEIEQKISAIKIPGVTDIRSNNRSQPTERKISTSRRPEYDDMPSGSSASTNETKDHVSPTKPRKVSAVPMNDDPYDDIPQYADDFDVGGMGGEDRPIRPKAQVSYNDPDPMLGENQSMIRDENFPKGQHPLEGIENYEDLPTPEELSGKSKEIADQGISHLIGEYRSRCLMSKVWALRAAALNKTIELLPEFEYDPGMNACFSALMAIVRVGVEDKMQQVFTDALNLLEGVLESSKKAKLPRTLVGPCVDPIIVNLIEKLSDTNIRIKDGAKRGMDLLMHAPVVVGPTFISNHALKSLNSKEQANWRVIVARIKLLADMVTDFGLGPNVGLSADSVMTFCKNLGAFAHGNGDVRNAAKHLTVAVQRLVGTPAIDSYLAELRPKQLEEYFASFGEIPHEISPKSSAPAKKEINNSNSNSNNNNNSNSNNSKVAASPKAASKPTQSSSSVNTPSASSHTSSHTSAPAKSSHPKQEITPPPAATVVKEPVNTTTPQNFTVCMFCGASDKTWNEDALDLHFWKSCPLLTPCPACAQVVEIAGLPEHLLDECEHKADYVPCDTTGLAIRKVEFESWQRSKNCKPPPDNCIYCPLCLSSVEDTDEAWKEHLMLGCPKNSRTHS